MNLGGIRVVHGCWDDGAVATLESGGWGQGKTLSDALISEVCRKVSPKEESPMMKARKLLTCGLEIDLPPGQFIVTKDGLQFDNVRVANWRDWAKDFHEVALVPPGQEELLKHMDWPRSGMRGSSG